MVLPVEDSREGGSRHPDIRDLIYGGGAGNPNLWIGGMVDISMHLEDAGQI